MEILCAGPHKEAQNFEWQISLKYSCIIKEEKVMMRSLYSGVAGLKTHQTRMDVIGNNIANVNTVGFKGSSVNFADTFYQTTSPATGPDAATAAAGSNAKQIGLGSQVASITTNITEQGGTSSTNRALDLAINGESFLIVKSGGATYFTKAGALNVDTNGTLYSTVNNATVQGWMADAEGIVQRDVVRDLTVMSADNLYYPPTATTNVTLKGNIDKNDKDLKVTLSDDGVAIDSGLVATISFYDKLGQLYTAKLLIVKPDEQPDAGADDTQLTSYRMYLGDVMDENGNSIFVREVTGDDGAVTYTATGATVTLGGAEYTVGEDAINAETGKFTTITGGGDGAALLNFNMKTGDFFSTTNNGEIPETSQYKTTGIMLSINPGDGDGAIDNTFDQYDPDSGTGGIIIDVSSLTQYSTMSNLTYTKGDKLEARGAGNIAGEMKGISIDEDGYVYGTYNNGSKKCLAQIPVATFNNPSGLEAVGNSLFAQTLNSGTFDGVGEAVSISGSFTVGALEMSNVDLASEFTTMITTQRGFQANSRIITTTDSMLEELVNLKR